MRFHGLLIVRDEADIIVESVKYALTWADAIYAYDTGSVDGTWELLQEMACKDSRLVLYRHESVYFQNDLRAVLFNEYRNRAETGDWFATVDADEFYHIPPPRFVKTRLRSCETAVSYQLYDFKLTDQEAALLEAPAAIANDRAKPVEARRRYYIPLSYAEPRLFRYRPTMQWVPPKAPSNLGYIARERIPIRHYPNRDPKQLEQRSRLRLLMRPHVGFSASPHWQVTDWRSLLVDQGDPKLSYWAPGTDLPRYGSMNHIPGLPKRCLQRLVHFGLLPLLDSIRPRFPDDYQAEAIPVEVQRQLQTAPHGPRD